MITLTVLVVAVLGLSSASRKPMGKWCVTNDEDECLCKQKKYSSCIRMETAMECAKLVAEGKASKVNLQGAEIIQAGKLYDLRSMIAVRTEDSLVYGDDPTVGYYTVIVAKKAESNKDFTLDKLRGLQACHTAINRNAGWYMIVGLLASRGLIDANRDTSPEELQQKVREFFGQSCLPGALAASKSCAICKGTCKADSSEPYFGYSGAMQCLAESGDVAFVKPSDIPQSGEYELLCPDGGSAPVNEYKRCFIAIVPSRIAATTKKNIVKFGKYLERKVAKKGGDKFVYPAQCSSKPKKLIFGLVKDKKYNQLLKPSYLEVMKLFVWKYRGRDQSLRNSPNLWALKMAAAAAVF